MKNDVKADLTPEETPEQAPEEQPADVLADELEPLEEAPKRYAVYDATLLRFVSGVVDTIEEADELLSNGAAGHDLEIREV